MKATTIAGMASTVLFVGSLLPMVWRAARTRDLTSYSLGHLAMTNIGNLMYSIYVLSLPAGPAWALHGVNTGVAALMLMWKTRERRRGSSGLVPLGQETMVMSRGDAGPAPCMT